MKLYATEYTPRIIEYADQHFLSDPPRSLWDELQYGLMTFYLLVVLLVMSFGWFGEWWVDFTMVTVFMITFMELVMCGLALWTEAVYRANLGNPKLRAILAKQLFSQRHGYLTIGNYRSWTFLVWLAQLLLFLSLGMTTSFWLWMTIFMCKIALEFLYASLAEQLFVWLDSEWKGKVRVSFP